MTPKLARITAAEAIRALERVGFMPSRQSGRHRRGVAVPLLARTIGILAPEPAVDEHYLPTGDVVAEAEAGEAEAVLAFTRGRPLELEDVVCSASVVRIRLQDLDRLGEEADELWVLIGKAPGQALKGWDRPDGKTRRHAL